MKITSAKLCQVLILAVFSLLILGLSTAQLLLPDRDITYSERRKLTQFPDITADALLSGKYSSSFEKYALDQFPMRDQFRTLKAMVHFRLLAQKDNNGIYLIGDRVFKTEYPLKERQVEIAAEKINEVYETYLSGMKVYYAIVPDKNYGTAAENGYPSLDYQRLDAIMRDTVSADIQEIPLYDCLDTDSYYHTDTHWLQHKLGPVVDRLAGAIGFTDSPFTLSDYTQHRLSPFYGVYYGQSALPLQPDEIIYLTNDVTDAATVRIAGTDLTPPVYDLEQFGSMDSYNIFLSGPQAVMTIENPLAETDRELIVFRDSFGSSLIPLLLPHYARITAVDLRYIPSALLNEYVTFTEGQDVLFLYSTLVLNTGSMLR